MPKTEPFDKHVDLYEDWFDRNPHAYVSEVEAVRKLLPTSGHGIEIGVGTGRFAEPLGIRTGLEPSVAMAQIARAHGISVVEGVAEHLPFQDCEYDFALMVTTVCFLDDVLASFKEVFRILRPKGSIVVGFVDKDSHMGQVYQEHKEESVFYKPATFFSTPEISALLVEAGFGDLRCVQTLFKDLSSAREVEPAIEGYGKGAFVVVRAERP